MLLNYEDTFKIRKIESNIGVGSENRKEKGGKMSVYSTKKSHSGLGLANINSIKNKYENMTISYEVPEGYFDFYLVIEPEEESEE